MSALLTEGRVETALGIVEPAVTAFLNRGPEWVKRSALHAVVLSAAGQVLGERSYGTMARRDWPHPFASIAFGKARVSLRTQMDTGLVIARFPQLLQSSDPKYRGGVYGHCFAVGVSGVQSEFDEMIAGWLRDTCIALCRHEMEVVVMPDDDRDYL